LKYFFLFKKKSSAKIWTLSDAKVIRTIDHPSRITTMTFTLDSIYVITGGEDCSCKIWELATGKLIQVLIDHDGAITSIAVPMNNSMVISGAKDKLVLVWNFKDGSVMHRLTAHTDIIVKVAITQDSSTVISGSRDGLICVWSSHHGNLLSSVLLQHILADLLISWDGSHIMARLDDSELMPVIGLTRKWPKELQITRTMSTSSLRSFERNFF
jgi:WD40 repeat protein